MGEEYPFDLMAFDAFPVIETGLTPDFSGTLVLSGGFSLALADGGDEYSGTIVLPSQNDYSDSKVLEV